MCWKEIIVRYVLRLPCSCWHFLFHTDLVTHTDVSWKKTYYLPNHRIVIRFDGRGRRHFFPNFCVWQNFHFEPVVTIRMIVFLSCDRPFSVRKCLNVFVRECVCVSVCVSCERAAYEDGIWYALSACDQLAGQRRLTNRNAYSFQKFKHSHGVKV